MFHISHVHPPVWEEDPSCKEMMRLVFWYCPNPAQKGFIDSHAPKLFYIRWHRLWPPSILLNCSYLSICHSWYLSVPLQLWPPMESPPGHLLPQFQLPVPSQSCCWALSYTNHASVPCIETIVLSTVIIKRILSIFMVHACQAYALAMATRIRGALYTNFVRAHQTPVQTRSAWELHILQVALALMALVSKIRACADFLAKDSQCHGFK